MKSTQWKDIAELVGISAIVASLVFVGLQMRQAHEITLAEIYQSRTAMVLDWANDMASNPIALSAVIKYSNGRADEIEPLEEMAAWYKNLGDMFLLENSHYQYSLGFLPQEHWERARRNLTSRMATPQFRRLIDDTKFNMRDSFRAVIDEIEAEVDGGPEQ